MHSYLIVNASCIHGLVLKLYRSFPVFNGLYYRKAKLDYALNAMPKIISVIVILLVIIFNAFILNTDMNRVLIHAKQEKGIAYDVRKHLHY